MQTFTYQALIEMPATARRRGEGFLCAVPAHASAMSAICICMQETVSRAYGDVDLMGLVPK